jgi:hypothetical protein
MLTNRGDDQLLDLGSGDATECGRAALFVCPWMRAVEM